MKLIKDYNYTIHYHPSKVNIVANVLNKKSLSCLAYLTVGILSLYGKMKELNVDLHMNELSVLLEHLRMQPTILDQVKSTQEVDHQLVNIMDEVISGVKTDFSLHKDVY